MTNEKIDSKHVEITVVRLEKGRDEGVCKRVELELGSEETDRTLHGKVVSATGWDIPYADGVWGFDGWQGLIVDLDYWCMGTFGEVCDEAHGMRYQLVCRGGIRYGDEIAGAFEDE